MVRERSGAPRAVGVVKAAALRRRVQAGAGQLLPSTTTNLLCSPPAHSAQAMAPPSEVILTSSSSTSTASGSTTLHDFTTAHQLATLKPSAPGPNSTAVLPTANGLGGICITVQEGKALAGVWAWQKVRQRTRRSSCRGLIVRRRAADLIMTLLPAFLLSPRSNSTRKSRSRRSSPASPSPRRARTAPAAPSPAMSTSGRSVPRISRDRERKRPRDRWLTSLVHQLASGLLFNSFDAHYRRVNILKFTQDGLGLVSGSDDSGVSVWSVAR